MWERNNKGKVFLRITIPIVLMSLFLLVTVFVFRTRIVEIFEADTESKLAEITIQMKRSFEKELNGRLDNLEILAAGVDIFYHGTESYYIASVVLEVMPGWYGMCVVNTQVIAQKLNFVLLLSTLSLVYFTFLFLFLYFVLSSAEIKNEQKQHKLAYFDTLTKLLKFEGLQLYSTGKEKEPHILVLFDIKHFHTTNFVMGKSYCDQLLKKIAVVLRTSVSHESGEFACRVKDDIFLLYLKNIASPKNSSFISNLKSI